MQTLLEGLLLGGSSKVKKIQELKIELSSIAVEARDNFKHLSTLVLSFPHHCERIQRMVLAACGSRASVCAAVAVDALLRAALGRQRGQDGRGDPGALASRRSVA